MNSRARELRRAATDGGHTAMNIRSRAMPGPTSERSKSREFQNPSFRR
jgi:hypothetical protein